MAYSSNLDSLFKYRHFDREIIILCVRWYLSYKLGYRGLVEMVAERGVRPAHSTVLRCVQRYVPEAPKVSSCSTIGSLTAGSRATREPACSARLSGHVDTRRFLRSSNGR